jgi:5-methylcytosine-specific restriction enzyme A
MTLAAITDPASVRKAAEEFDRLGRDAFLAKYGYGPSRRYFLSLNGRLYDSKAIVGAAHGYEFSSHTLQASDFSGGEATVQRKLEELGFQVVVMDVPTAAQRNPPWERDELILALDLYMQEGLVGSGHRSVVELSELLNRLQLHPLRPDPDRFRNPTGVHLKLADFAALDPHHAGTGMTHGSALDREVWDEFWNDPERLAMVARAIRFVAPQQQEEPLAPEEGEDEAVEGRLLFRRHRVRERDRRLVDRKKQRALHELGRLLCEVCGFDFERSYGKHGQGYIECHHLVPLAKAGTVTRTRLADLALVCANCHRMLHRGNPSPTVVELREHLAGNRQASDEGSVVL